MIALALALAFHPIHTTSATMVIGGAEAHISIRAFVEDFPPGADSAGAARYLAARFTLTGPDGRRLPVSLGHLEAVGGVVTLALVVRHEGPWTGVRIGNQLLCERFEDQVNVVQVRGDKGTQTLLFTPGGSAQAVR